MKLRPRFSIRALTIFVTLLCVYLGAWEATKKWGVRDLVMRHYPSIEEIFVDETRVESSEPFVTEESLNELMDKGIYSAPMPFIVSGIGGVDRPLFPLVRRFYVWFAGMLVELPISLDVNPADF